MPYFSLSGPPPHPPHPHPPHPHPGPSPSPFFPGYGYPYYGYGPVYAEPVYVVERSTPADSTRSDAATQYVYGAYCFGYYKAIGNAAEQARCKGIVDGIQNVLAKSVTVALMNKMYDFGFGLGTSDGLAKRPLKNQAQVKQAITEAGV